VIVAGTSFGQDDPRRGDDERAIAMARTALAHLGDVQGTLARTAAATPARRPVRVGYLTESYWGLLTLLQVFHERLAALGWVRGRDLAIEYRFADGRPERLPEMAAELVRERVDVIVPLSLPSALAARDAAEGSGIPVVFVLHDGSDPVAGGLVASLARPGANITGIAFPDSAGLAAKRLDLLAEALPSITRVGVLIEAADGPLWRELEETARARGVELLPQEIRSPADIPAAVAAAKAAGAQALLQADGTINTAGTGPVLNTLAAQHGLPWVSNFSHYGGLLVYTQSVHAVVLRSAEYVDLVLRGIPPAQLPVEVVRDYDLIVNLGVAQRLGLEVAPSVLARATHLIDQTAGRPRRVR
jgi:putative ABC transport system substrate-binding protein